MGLDHGTRSLFNPVKVGLHKGVTQPGYAQDTDTGAHAGLKGAGVQNQVGFDATQDGGQGGHAQHDDQDGIGGVHQRCRHQPHAWAVDDGISHYAQYASQEQQHGGFRTRFDHDDVLTTQGNQTFFEALLIHRIVRQLGVKQPSDQQRHQYHSQEGGRDHHHQQV
ncbi:hypothetical protein D3C75_1024890 [compost metagenome]